MSAVRIRPPKRSKWSELFRLADNGRWLPDDGKPGRAFYGRGSQDGTGQLVWPYAFSHGTRHDYSDREIQYRAMDACCDRYGCANGRRVSSQGRWI